MKQILLPVLLFVLIGCNQKKKQEMSKENQEKIGTVVLILAKANPKYSKEETLKLSRAIDPMINEFEGYYGRKMIYGIEKPDLMGDIVFYKDIPSFEMASEIEMKSETCQKFFATMLPDPESSKMLITSLQISTINKQEEAKVVEVALFRAKPQYAKEDVIRAAKAINPVLENIAGFISRKLSVTEDGQWVDVLYWSSLKQAKNALQLVVKNKICQDFFKMTDDTTSELLHFNIVIDTER